MTAIAIIGLGVFVTGLIAVNRARTPNGAYLGMAISILGVVIGAAALIGRLLA